MLIGYRYPQTVAVQGGAGPYSRHRFKHSGASNLCLLSRGALVHQLCT